MWNFLKIIIGYFTIVHLVFKNQLEKLGIRTLLEQKVLEIIKKYVSLAFFQNVPLKTSSTK